MAAAPKRAPARKPKQSDSAPKLKGAPSPKVKVSTRKPSAPKPVVFNIVKGGGIWYKLRQNNIIVFDEEAGYNREIRYCPAERSVYMDEQSESARRSQIVFRDGMLTVGHTDPVLLEFLRLHPDNIANGGTRFNEVNTEVNAKAELDREFAMHDAVDVIKTTPLEQLMPLALSYGIGSDLSSMEIKRALLQHAKANPVDFLAAVDSPMVKLKANVITALDFQILKEDNEGMYWNDTNTLIMQTPMGQDTVSTFTRFLMTDKGNSVRDEIERQLDSL